jgi:hypothetical protein
MGEPTPRLKQVLHAGLLARDGAAQPVAPSPLPVGVLIIERGEGEGPTTVGGSVLDCLDCMSACLCCPCIRCWECFFPPKDR